LNIKVTKINQSRKKRRKTRKRQCGKYAKVLQWRFTIIDMFTASTYSLAQRERRKWQKPPRVPRASGWLSFDRLKEKQSRETFWTGNRLSNVNRVASTLCGVGSRKKKSDLEAMNVLQVSW
jgi:hypothetical protein